MDHAGRRDQPHDSRVGDRSQQADGAGRYDPLVDAWYPVSTSGAPEEEPRAMTAWSGTEMLVKIWSDYHRYDPVLDVWNPMSSESARTVGSSSVWTGKKWIIWGGTDYCDASGTGVIYDPVTDEWSPVSNVGGPAPRGYHAAVWTGSEMIVWGGYRHYWHDYGGGQEPVCLTEALFDGARYDPATFMIQGLVDPEFVDTDPVQAGAAFTYLIRGENSCGAGGLGSNSSGLPRSPDPTP